MEPRIWSFEWTDAMSVGIPEIDEDHKRFIALVDAFNESIAERAAIRSRPVSAAQSLRRMINP